MQKGWYYPYPAAVPSSRAKKTVRREITSAPPDHSWFSSTSTQDTGLDVNPRQYGSKLACNSKMHWAAR